MKNREGYYTVLVWVIELRNNIMGGWDYKVRQKDNQHREWIGDEYWRAETQLKRAT